MTDEEYQQQKAALAAEDARRAEIQRAADAARIAPLTSITGSPAFGEVKAAAEALPIELQADPVLGPHIKALLIGLKYLPILAPPPAPSAPSPTE